MAFLIIGYQSALFVRRAAMLRIASHRDAPDTIYVIDESLARRLLDDTTPSVSASNSSSPSSHSNHSNPSGYSSHSSHSNPSGHSSFSARSNSSSTLPDRSSSDASSSNSSGTSSDVIRHNSSDVIRHNSSNVIRHNSSNVIHHNSSDVILSEANGSVTIRRNAPHSAAVQSVTPRRVESFPFNPNTVSLSDLQRLGFSERQAQSIINYREKGGRFRRPSDFAKSFVVSDSVFRRLEPFIRIPKVDLNTADSTALDALPGIGPYYAAKIVEYREKLRGYSYPEQLMDISRFDREKFDALSDLVTIGPSEPYPLWTLPESELEKHPYIGKYAAHGVVLFRENNPASRWTVEALREAGVLRPADAARLARCRLSSP